MDSKAIIKYVLTQDIVDMPALQKRFEISYGEIKSLMDLMVNAKMLEYVSGVTFKVLTKKSVENDEPFVVYENDPDKIVYKKALWECVKRQTVSIAVIQRELKIGFNRAGRAIEWMEENGFVVSYPEKKVLITEEEYKRFFGDPDKPYKSDCEMRFVGIDENTQREAEIIRTTMYDLVRSDDEDDDDCCDEPDNCEENSDNVGKINECLDLFKTNVENYQKYLNGEQTEELENKRDTFESQLEKGYSNLHDMLAACFMLGLRERVEGEEYVIAMDDVTDFEIKFVDNGNSIKVSDGGFTLLESGITKQRIKNALKNYPPVKLDDNEITVTVNCPDDALRSIMILYAAVAAIKRMK